MRMRRSFQLPSKTHPTLFILCVLTCSVRYKSSKTKKTLPSKYKQEVEDDDEVEEIPMPKYVNIYHHI